MAIPWKLRKERCEQRIKDNPLVKGLVGDPTITWNGRKVTVVYHNVAFLKDGKFDAHSLTNVSPDEAELFVCGISMGIALMYDKDMKKLRDEINTKLAEGVA